MRLESLAIDGPLLVHADVIPDERGFFSRLWDGTELAKHGMDASVAQMSAAGNTSRGTLRGMHLQVAPHDEAKLVRCVRGAVQDVVVDARAGSPTCGTWCAVELSPSTAALLVPRGFAHGYITRVDDTVLEYLISTPYTPTAAAGIRWDDPAIGITWDLEPHVISARDQAFPDVDLDRLRADGPAALLRS